MERKEALDGIYCESSGEIYDQNAELINKIYDDYESRTCSNCRHFTFEHIGIGSCGELVDTEKIPDLNDHVVRHDFGCNKFEAKS